jgi:hypothetical protein
MTRLTNDLLGAGLDWLIPRLDSTARAIDRETLVRKWDYLVPSEAPDGALLAFEIRGHYAVLFEAALAALRTSSEEKVVEDFASYLFPVLLRFARLDPEALGEAVEHDNLHGFVKASYSEHGDAIVQAIQAL